MQLAEKLGITLNELLCYFFSDIYKPDVPYNILMRAMGIFIFGCETTISYYAHKIRKELTI